MNNKLDKGIVYVKEKKSGFLWVGIGLLLLIIALPLVLYGLGRATVNGFIWVGQHPDRKLRKLERKQNKISTKQNIKQLKDSNKEYKEAKKGK